MWCQWWATMIWLITGGPVEGRRIIFKPFRINPGFLPLWRVGFRKVQNGWGGFRKYRKKERHGTRKISHHRIRTRICCLSVFRRIAINEKEKSKRFLKRRRSHFRKSKSRGTVLEKIFSKTKTWSRNRKKHRNRTRIWHVAVFFYFCWLPKSEEISYFSKRKAIDNK